MGVPSFFYWIFKSYPDIVHKIKGFEDRDKIPIVDTYALDLNAIIHPVCQEIFKTSSGSLLHPKPLRDYSYEYIYGKICDRIEELFKLVSPRKRYIIAIDGCCPVAKQSQQRLRRFKAVKEKLPSELKRFDS